VPVQEVEAFIDHCQDCVTLEDGELLPMAARLLSDAQLAQLDDAMRGRRAGPT
jgi:hemerythrin-like domain-containing protein